MSEEKIKGVEKSVKMKLKDQIQYRAGGVANKTIAQNDGTRLALFAFDRGQGLGEHASNGDALATVLEGVGRFVVDGREIELLEGESVAIPARTPHSVAAEGPFKMLLAVVFNE